MRVRSYFRPRETSASESSRRSLLAAKWVLILVLWNELRSHTLHLQKLWSWMTDLAGMYRTHIKQTWWLLVGTRMWGLLSITWTILPPFTSWRKVALDMVSQISCYETQQNLFISCVPYCLTWNLCCIMSGELLVFNLILKHSKIFLWISSIKGLISRVTSFGTADWSPEIVFNFSTLVCCFLCMLKSFECHFFINFFTI